MSDDDITPLQAGADVEVTHAHILKRLDRLEERLEPVFEINWKDIAALSRSGRIIGHLILWTGGLVAALAATWAFLNEKI